MDRKEQLSDTNESLQNPLIPPAKRSLPEEKDSCDDSSDGNTGRWTPIEHLKFVEGTLMPSIKKK